VDHLGRRVGEADIAVFEITLDIEIDGPHHRMPEQREADQARDRLVRRAGWEVERFPTELVEQQPVVFRARVQEAIKHRLEVVGRHGWASIGAEGS
jgi:very-short-patch-repair endonuclease